MNDSVDDRPSPQRRLIWDFVCLVLPFLGLITMLIVETRLILSRRSDYLLPFAWLGLVLLVFFAPKTLHATSQRRWLSFLFLLAALVAGVAGALWFRPSLSHVAIALAFVAWGLIRLAEGWERVIGLALLLLATALLPSFIEQRLIYLEQSFLSTISSYLFDIFGIYHLYELPFLKLKNHTFNLVELFNIPVSVQAMSLFAIFIGLAWRRGFATSVMTVLTAGVWALAAKLVFVMMVAGYSEQGTDITQTSGYVWWLLLIGFVTVILILISDVFWNEVLSPIRLGEDAALYRSVAANFFNRFTDWPKRIDADLDYSEQAAIYPPTGKPPVVMAVIVGLVLVASAVPVTLVVMKTGIFDSGAKLAVFDANRLPTEETLPQDFFVGQIFRRFRGGANEFAGGGAGGSWIWNYTGTGSESNLMVVLPVDGLVNPQLLTTNAAEWNRSSYGLQNDASGWPWIEVTMKKEGRSAYVWSTQVRASGDYYQATEEEFNALMAGSSTDLSSWTPRLFAMMKDGESGLNRQSALIALVYEVEGEIRDSERDRVRSKFLEARTLLRNRVFGLSPTPKAGGQ